MERYHWSDQTDGFSKLCQQGLKQDNSDKGPVVRRGVEAGGHIKAATSENGPIFLITTTKASEATHEAA